MKYIAKKKYSVNFIDYLGFLIGLMYETITKIANKIQQFRTEIIQKNKHLGVFRSDKHGCCFFVKKSDGVHFFMYIISLE
jgi:hypothetical protein